MSRTQLLLDWYKEHGRDLPWRHTHDPYAILVSEVMLQQTQVDRVVLFYERWLKSYPDWSTLAKASNADVIEHWAGLGYNRRALMLRNAAKQVVEEGEPTTLEGWLGVKGVGPYTARAVMLFSQEQPVYPIDTNLRRLGARLFLGVPFPDPKTHDEAIQKAGEAFVSETMDVYQLGQALFDVSSQVCKKNPLCDECPFQDICPAKTLFDEGVEIPKRSTPKAKERIHTGKQHPDRIYRGHILKEVRLAGAEGVTRSQLVKEVDLSYDNDLDKDWFDHMLQRLENDGFILKEGRRWILKK